MGPWSPDWRPDLTGQRLVAIRAARRGALFGAVLFGVTVAIAVMLAPAVEVARDDLRLGFAIVVATGSIPGLGLLGAILTPSALEGRVTSIVAGVAMGIAAPTAAAFSAMIGVFVAVGLVSGFSQGVDVAGQTLDTGVEAAIGVAPLIVVASAAWVVAVRRWAPRSPAEPAEPAGGRDGT